MVRSGESPFPSLPALSSFHGAPLLKTKNMPKLDMALPSEDSTCAICDDSEGENSNAIVFCDGCNLAVHQDCYGVPYIPEGQWLCRKCTVSPENPVSCMLCPNEGGAFKQTTNGEWVHLLCAIWVPETRVANEVFMEPITGVEKISKQRWKLKCNVCDIREGACIQCAKTSCFLAFHATCARREKLLLPMKAAQGSEPVSLTCYCDRHLPKEQQDSRTAALAADEVNEGSDGTHDPKLSKTARAYAKTYKPGPPLVPAIIMERIAHYITKIPMRKKPEFLAMVCRYWSLKREARRGAPLLKRLHLEPWTANATNKLQSQEEKLMILEQLTIMKRGMDQAKLLAELTFKRERIKQKQKQAIQEVLQSFVLCYTNKLRLAFEGIMSIDKKGYFKSPVLKAEVPDYYDIITRPMCWSIIDEKLNRHEYWDVQAFKHDVDLLVDNALLYNKPGSLYHKVALKIQEGAQTKFAELVSQMQAERAPEGAGVGVNPETNDADASRATPPIGDLEPPLELVELLVSTDAIADDLDIFLDDNPLSSLFEYSLPRLKPPPPPPPPPPPKAPKAPKASKSKRKKPEPKKNQPIPVSDAVARRPLVNGEASRIQLDQEEPQVKIDVPLEISTAPRTRRAIAAAAAAAAEIEAEAEAVEVEIEMEVAPSPKEEVVVIPVPPTPTQISLRRRMPRKFPGDPPAPLPESEPEFEPTPAPEAEEEEEEEEDANQIVVVDEPTSGELEDPDAGKRGRRKRVSSFPNPADSIPLMQYVDNQQSFKMFDQGWIFPANTRRGGRVPMEKVEVPVRPKKKPRTGPAPSRLSLVSTAPSENLTLDTSQIADEEPILIHDEPPPATDEDAMDEDASPPVEEAPVPAGDESMDVDLEDPEGVPDPDETEYASRGPTPALIPPEQFAIPPLGTFIPPTTLIKAPDGTVIIEELDTPAIRREKNRREKARRAEEQRNRLVADQALSTGVLPHPTVLSGPGIPGPAPFSRDGLEIPLRAGPSGVGKVEGSELSILPEEGGKNRRVIGNGTKLEGGVLVWAKAGRFPWWPAVIFEDDDPQVPPNILAECLSKRTKTNDPDVQIIRFFDKTDSWQFLPLKFLKEFGEDTELDSEMIAANSRYQNWKNGSVRADCREAYRRALAEMETDNEVAEMSGPRAQPNESVSESA
ncbi:hypothetical protein BDZ94DRAFT_1189141 [Collybia nuda]|uniref:Uncharacterized protein n=1 Tax=Collybia nuda TaxID=64659 RepID=A0A9P6CGS9_9AGAR|nr:hypothetical protein BDZ94DRAFT_1189141 [Collybia nuda]